MLDKDFIYFNNCTSVERQDREECTGACHSFEGNRVYIADLAYSFEQRGCNCCSADETISVDIPFSCYDNAGQLQTKMATYVHIKSCRCNACN